MKALAEFLEARIPFDGDQSLRCILSGVVADETVKVTATEIGENVLKNMEIKRQLWHEGLRRILVASIPFDGDQSLRCILSGVVADETVKVTATEIGESVLKSMEIKRQLWHEGHSRVSRR